MEPETILVQQDGRVRTISMNRPEVRNAQSKKMLRELNTALESAAKDDSVGAIILAGEGKDFSSGHDISPEETIPDADLSWEARYLLCQEIYLEYTLAWRDLPKPILAQVQGNCIMGGLMVALACDFIICADNARFFTRVIQWDISNLQFSVLPWAIGVPQAKQLMYTGETFEAQKALQLGMINEVVPLAELSQRTKQIAREIASQDPFALRMAKKMCNSVLDLQGQRTHLEMAFQAFGLTAFRPATQARWQEENNFSASERIRRRDSKDDDSNEA
jgi:enoyl-CoA hydratase